MVKRTVTDIAVSRNDDFAEVPFLAFRRLKDVYRIVVFIGMILIKKDTSRSLAVFRAGVARVVSQKRMRLCIFYDFLRYVEFPFEFWVFIQLVVNHVKGVFYLLFGIGDKLNVVLRDSVQWRLEKIRKWSHESVFAVPASHQDDDFRKKRFSILSVHENKGKNKLLIRKERIVIRFQIPYAVPKSRLIKNNVIPL